MTSRTCCDVTVRSVCSVPRWRATAAACFDSSKSAFSNPMVNVFTGPTLAAFIRATTVEESMPPDRNAPSGTSAIMRRFTASWSNSSSWSVSSVSLPRSGDRSPVRATSRADQKRVRRGSPSGGSVRTPPGSSLFTSS